MIRLFDEWLLLPQRIALHAPTGTAVLADLHLGYHAARQRLGDAIPWRTVAEEMQPLVDAVALHDVRSVIIAGDLFERGYDDSLHQEFLTLLNRLHLRFLALVPGNHDRGLDKATLPFPIFAFGYDLAGWQILHGDQPTESANAIMGHWHPALRRGRRKLACFLVKNHHLVLPAFSLDAAGVDVGKDARWSDWERYAVEGERVFHMID